MPIREIEHMAGGKGSSRDIYLQYYDTDDGGYKFAKLIWPVSQTKPTLVTATSRANLIASIEEQYPSFNITDWTLTLVGSSDYGSIFIRFQDDNTEQYHIAEMGAGSDFSLSGPTWGLDAIDMYTGITCGYTATAGRNPHGCWMSGGMSPSEDALIENINVIGTGHVWVPALPGMTASEDSSDIPFHLPGTGLRTYSDSEDSNDIPFHLPDTGLRTYSDPYWPGCDLNDKKVRMAVYTGGTLADPTGATLLWDAGIIEMRPHQPDQNWWNNVWTQEHPGGGVVLPANTVTWIVIKWYDDFEYPGTEDWYPGTVYSNCVVEGNFPVGTETCGDFQNGRGTYILTSADAGINAIDDSVYTSFPASIPSGGVWSTTLDLTTCSAYPDFGTLGCNYDAYSVMYLGIELLGSSSSISISDSYTSESYNPLDANWSFGRLIDLYDYTSETDIKFIDIVDNEVFITAGSPMTESTFLSDDFTGSNGNPPNSGKWNINSGSPDIQNNSLELTQIGSGTADWVTWASCIGGDYYSSQIDVTVDFELISYAAVESWGIVLGIHNYETLVEVAYVRYGYWGGQYGYQLSYLFSGYWYSYDVMIGSSPHTTGKLRIVARNREPRELIGYYWDGADWVQIGMTDRYGIRECTISLGVRNFTASQNITWRADNFAISSGFNVYRQIYVYEEDSFNSSTKQFETLIQSKNLDMYDVSAVSAGTGGCAVIRNKYGWYWNDQPMESYTDLATYDSSLDIVNVSCLRAEWLLGSWCNWQRDIYWGDNWLNEGGPWTVCGNYPNNLFLSGTLLFYDGDDTYQAIIEVDGTTLKPIRASLLQTTSTAFDGTEIQDAITIE